MIGGAIAFLLLKKEKEKGKSVFIGSSKEITNEDVIKIPCHIDFVSEYGTKAAHLNINQLKMFVKWRKEFKDALFEDEKETKPIGELGEKYQIKVLTEYGKMSKRYFNTIDPEKICDLYGADTLRCYEMFLGPIEEHKPWNVNGISGVEGFLNKTWKLFSRANEEIAKETELKVLHKTIKKVTEDIEKLSLNTVISTFMIAINEWTKQNCSSKEVLSPFLVLLSPFAPHIAEELWLKIGNNKSISNEKWPKVNEKYLIEQQHEYPISFNGKMRFKIAIDTNLNKEEIEQIVLKDERTSKYLSGSPKKVIVVPRKIVNIVL
jgi:leucyl-tRNA synthetase